MTKKERIAKLEDRVLRLEQLVTQLMRNPYYQPPTEPYLKPPFTVTSDDNVEYKL